jgi:hypothetical protein
MPGSGSPSHGAGFSLLLSSAPPFLPAFDDSPARIPDGAGLASLGVHCPRASRMAQPIWPPMIRNRPG